MVARFALLDLLAVEMSPPQRGIFDAGNLRRRVFTMNFS
jgi:hypothetical protein